MSQIKGILGVRFKGDTVKDILEKLIEHFHERRSGDMILGIGAIIVILSLRVRFILVCLYFQVKCLDDLSADPKGGPGGPGPTQHF